jgi:hypothetical protein
LERVPLRDARTQVTASHDNLRKRQHGGKEGRHLRKLTIDDEVSSSPTRRIIFTTAAEKKHAKRRNDSEKD